jgi:nucleoside-diphosphate-sugar epimerase
VFVAGGTGAVGGYAIPALVRAGHSVTALARTPEKAAALTAQGATPVSASLFDRSALTTAFNGHDAVVNLATAIPPMSRWMSAKAWRSNDRARTEGSTAVVDAALAAGVDRLVQESVSMLYRDHGARWVDEDAPIDRYPMARGNLAAEANVHRFSEAGGTGIVLRFGWFYGQGRHPQRAVVRLGPSPRRPCPGTTWQLCVLDPRGRRRRGRRCGAARRGGNVQHC